MKQRRDRLPLRRGAAQHLLGAVEDQRAVREAGERVVAGEEGELLAAAVELGVLADALRLEDLAHPHKRHVERGLRHRERATASAIGDAVLGGRFAEHVPDTVAPAQAALRDLVQRRLAVRGQLPEQLERFAGRVAAVLRAPARHPVCDRDRRDRADPLQAVIDLRRQLAVRLGRTLDHQLEHARRPRAQRRAEDTNLLGKSLSLVVSGSGHGSYTPRAPLG